MFSATYFTYAGVYSGQFGLMIADFDQDNVIETQSFAPTINTTSIRRLNRTYVTSVSYDSPPTYEFSIISQYPLPLTTRELAIAWLTQNNEYKDLIFHQTNPDGTRLDDFKFKCVFSNVSLIYINTNCHGFRITAQFDSPYARGASTVVTASPNNTTVQVTINNRSDIKDYVYPLLTYTMANNTTLADALTVYNLTDDGLRSRPTILKKQTSELPFGVGYSDTVTLDNEMKRIVNSNSGKVETLSCFNKKWLRLRPGMNTLEITGNGTVTITCPRYALIGL